MEDAAAVSQSLFGNFLLGSEDSQLVLLRANAVVEAHFVGLEGLRMLCSYRASGFKISKIIKVRKPVICPQGQAPANGKMDMLVVHILPLKFVTLEIDPLINEFRIVCIHNLSNDVRLQESGKLNSARQGFLQSFCLERQVMKDDHQGQANHHNSQSKTEKGRPRKASQ